jgi:hypothetical protein
MREGGPTVVGEQSVAPEQVRQRDPAQAAADAPKELASGRGMG